MLVILLDAARSDRLSCYGYQRETTPNIDALAAGGAVFLTNYAQGTNTVQSLPTLLYSRYFTVSLFPFSSDVPLTAPATLFQTEDDESLSMPALFRAAGYHTAGISAHTWTRKGTAFAREFDEWHDLSRELEVQPGRGYPRAEPVIDFAIDWLEEHESEDFLLYLHLMDTHFPHFPDGFVERWLGGPRPAPDRFDPGGEPIDPGRELQPSEREYLDALYDGSLSYTDHHLGRLFEALEGGPLLEDGLLALIADHGESLLERPGVFGHGFSAREPEGRVPFVLVGHRRVPPGRHEYPTGLVDLLPTLAGLMELPVPAGKSFDGLDLSPFLSGASPPRDWVGLWEGLRVRDFKALFRMPMDQVLGEHGPPPDQIRGRLFDLAADPGEQKDLRGKRAEDWHKVVSAYRKELGPLYRRWQAARTTEQPRGAFAIGARDFLIREESAAPGLEEVQGEDDDPLPEGDASAWTLDKTWPDFHLRCRGSPGPVELSFPLPDGEYRVELAMRGAIQVQVQDQDEPTLLQARPFDPGVHPRDSDVLPLGLVRVRDQRFHLTLIPVPGVERFYLRRLGFTPESTGTGPEADFDPGYEERLRALGYTGR